jgi:hypothetical protein
LSIVLRADARDAHILVVHVLRVVLGEERERRTRTTEDELAVVRVLNDGHARVCDAAPEERERVHLDLLHGGGRGVRERTPEEAQDVRNGVANRRGLGRGCHLRTSAESGSRRRAGRRRCGVVEHLCEVGGGKRQGEGEEALKEHKGIGVHNYMM